MMAARMSERPGATSNIPVRVVCCPQCQHKGLIAATVPTTAKIRCTACGERWLVREATGAHPCRSKRAAKQAKSAAAKEVLQRYGELPDDGVTDLWRPRDN